ncbi:MAG: HPr(Ser) kinase/phosphatase [Pyrinomonadaceae bacterium]
MPADTPSENLKISVADFIKNAPAELKFEILAGAGGLHNKEITSSLVHKLGLALAGLPLREHAGGVQIIGRDEIAYLLQLDRKRKVEVLKTLDCENISCILIAENLDAPPEFLQMADAKNLPVIHTLQTASNIINLASNYLHEILAPQMNVHGVLLGMYGVGVLIRGESGVGKSECALDLIVRGHRLVSDDRIILKRIGGRLEGSSPELTYGHLEIRGLGIVNVRDLFGVSTIRRLKQIDLVIELKRWANAAEVERLGLERREDEIFDVKIPKFILPVSAGRNLSTLIETAVRIHLSRESGFDAARDLIEKHSAMLDQE